MLCRCWLGGRKGIRPVKTELWGAGMVICLQQVADLHMSQLMPLPLIVSCFSKIEIGFTFLVLAYLDSPGQRAIKRVCVCVCSHWSFAPAAVRELQFGSCVVNEALPPVACCSGVVKSIGLQCAV